jgi:RNA polymerase sigma-70 factor (ECF subfamily)
MGSRLDSSSTDDALVREVRRSGSETAFSILYDRHTPRLLQTAWRMFGGAGHAAEDAVQDAWVRACGSLAEWRGDAPFAAWVRGIVVHIVLDTLRRDRRFVDQFDAAIEDGPPDEWLDLESAIAALPAGYRAVLVLHDIEGFTHEEIGAQLGITSGTSKGQLFKARRAVRAWLTRDCDAKREVNSARR